MADSRKLLISPTLLPSSFPPAAYSNPVPGLMVVSLLESKSAGFWYEWSTFNNSASLAIFVSPLYLLIWVGQHLTDIFLRCWEN